MNNKLIPYQKLSKKAKRQADAKKRGSWYGLSPVTRSPLPSSAYKRSQVRAATRRGLLADA